MELISNRKNLSIMLKSIKSQIKEVKAAFTSHIPYTPKQQALLKTLMFAVLLVTINYCFGQDGNAGIQQATSQVKGYFDAGCSLMYAIGAVVGIIGAIKVLCAMNCLAA
jgi:hypothetical protein